MTDKLAEIQQRHANGYKGIDAERAFPDVAALLSAVEWLKIAEQRRTEELQTAMAENERIRQHWALEEHNVNMLKAENERLRNEANDEAQLLRAQAVVIRDLRAENERLRADVADLLPRLDADAMHINNLARELKQADAENKRLHEIAAAAQRRQEELETEIERLRALLAEIRAMVDRQAEDESLWFNARTAPEAYLQQELRDLHDRVERFTFAPAGSLGRHKECYMEQT